MGKYRVISGQNLYDVALHIYGSIEGVTDLLVTNPALSMGTRLSEGTELYYTDNYIINPETVAFNRTQAVVPANGERNVYFKESTLPLIADITIDSALTSSTVSFSGSGTLEIDWGDNTPLESIALSPSLRQVAHTFDNSVSGGRKIRIYGDCRLRQSELTALNPSALFLLRPVYAEEFTLRNSRAPLDYLALFEGLYRLDLSGLKTNNLLPIAECRELMCLDLSGIDTLRETLDELLITMVREHYGRRSCQVTLSEYPSGKYREPERDEDLNYIVRSGMEAIWLLCNEPAWNEGGSWSFNISGKIFRYE